MATLFDPTKLLMVLLADERLEPSLVPVIRSPALKALEAALKAKSFGVRDLKSVRRALGGEEFELVIDALKDSALRSAIKRLDPDHPQVAGATGSIDSAWARSHFAALATGKTKPCEPVKSLDRMLAGKDRTQQKLRRLADDVGPNGIIASLMAMKDPAARSFVKKVDPRHSKAKGRAAGIDADWARRHLAKLAGISIPDSVQNEETGAEWFERLQRTYATKRR